MTRYRVLVAADNVLQALRPFRVSGGGLPPFVRECLCTRGADDDYTHPPYAACKLCGGRGIYETDVNPVGRWDSFLATTGQFRWLPGRRPMRTRDDDAGLHSGHWANDLPGLRAIADEDWDQARKGDLDCASMLASGWEPLAALAGGVWHQSDRDGWFPSIFRVTDRVSFSDDWSADFKALSAA